MDIHSKIIEIDDRFRSHGAPALTERELVVKHVSDLAYLVTAGGVSGFLYNTDEAQRSEMHAAVKKLAMPGLVAWFEQVLTRVDGEDFGDLSVSFDELETRIYESLQEYLGTPDAG